jgi:hypothetical protein
VMFECREVRSVVRLAHDLLDPSSADYPSLVSRPLRNSLAATVIRVTGGAQIRHFVMAITGCRQAARRIPAQSDEWSGYHDHYN